MRANRYEDDDRFKLTAEFVSTMLKPLLPLSNDNGVQYIQEGWYTGNHKSEDTERPLTRSLSTSLGRGIMTLVDTKRCAPVEGIHSVRKCLISHRRDVRNVRGRGSPAFPWSLLEHSPPFLFERMPG